MNRISPVGEKCVNRPNNTKYWLLNAFFVIATVWMLFVFSTNVNAQTPGTTQPANTQTPCKGTATSVPTDVVESPIGPSAMGLGGLLGYRGPFYAVTDSINSLMIQIVNGGNTAPTDLAVNDPGQTQLNPQAGPCVAPMPATKPKQ